MSHRFVIGGLPRSGTAWVATLLNLHTGVFCYHDLVATASGNSYMEAMELPGYRSVGDCSSAAVAPAFDDLQATRLFISRDAQDCLDSLIAKMGPEIGGQLFSVSQKLCEDWITKFSPTIINYDLLFNAKDEKKQADEAAHLVEIATDMPFSLRAFNFMKHLNVQIEGLSPSYYDGKKLITNL